MAKFKVGDTVRSIHSDKVYAVKEIELFSEWSKQQVYECEDGIFNDTVRFYEEDLELIENKKEYMKINYHVLNDSVILNYGGKTQVIARDDGRYDAVLNCIRDANGDEEKLAASIPDAVEIERRFNGNGIELVDGLLVANNEMLPAELEDRILKFKEAKLPYDALLKFWDNLKKNPSFNARKMLFKFLEHNGHPLTSDGCFIAYRGVTEDFKDVHTKKFDNKPGSVCEMDRSLVDDNPNNTCSTGLHVACYSYAEGFGSKLVEVKVNPTDVVCVPVDYNGTKMRVCRFEVIQECEGIKQNLLEEDESETEDEFCEDCTGLVEDCNCETHCPCGEEKIPFANFCSSCGAEVS